MIIKAPGKYRLLCDWSSRGSMSIRHFMEGRVIEIRQIDEQCHKVLGPDLEDWIYWDMPVEPITNNGGE